MNRSLLLLGALAVATPLSSALAWVHAGGWSGDRSSWSAHDWRGGSASGGNGSHAAQNDSASDDDGGFELF